MPETVFNLPDLGEGLTEGEILQWLVAVGDEVKLNQPIVEVETAKAAVEIPSPVAGTVSALLHEAGAVVETGAPLLKFETASAAIATEPTEKKPERQAVLVGYGPRTDTAQRRRRRSTPLLPTIPDELDSAAKPVRHGGLELGRAVEQAATQAPVSPAPIRSRREDSAPLSGEVRALAKPPVRKLARDLGVDLAVVSGSGAGGVITRDDVQQAAVSGPVAPTGGEQRIPVKGVRKLTAEAMVQSAFTAPHVSCFLDVDVTASMQVLEALKGSPELRDIRVGPLVLVARAVMAAIKRQPVLNSHWDDVEQEIVVKERVNLGIAAATERGLIVPVIHGADTLSLPDLALSITELANTARSGKTTPADMQGGSFTISNIGVFGVDTGTPIIPPGQAAILALGAITKRPWVVADNEIAARDVTTLAVSFDHRIIDGEQGSKFLADVGRYLRDPAATSLAWS